MMLDRARAGSHALLIGVCALTILPFWWMLSTSFKQANAIFDLNPLPVSPTLQNYAQMWIAIPMGSMLLNTFFNAGLLMAGQVVVATLAAYAFARWRLRGDNLLVLFVGTWLVPFQVTMLPNYVVLSRLGWLDSLAALVVPPWNEYFWPLLVTSRPDHTVAQVGLQMFLSAEGEQWGPLMAAATIATVPVLGVYVVFQRQVVEAFVRSGLR
jgi:sn-glycerol 3-phosphate transport system permease protein